MWQSSHIWGYLLCPPEALFLSRWSSLSILYSTVLHLFIIKTTSLWGRMDTCIYMTESLHCSPETITSLLISYVLCLVAQSCLTLYDPMDCSPPGSSIHGDSPGKNTGVGYHALLQGIFLTQESHQGLLHCKQILYQLSYQRYLIQTHGIHKFD